MTKSSSVSAAGVAYRLGGAVFLALVAAACWSTAPSEPLPWEIENPLKPIPAAPLGNAIVLAKLPNPPTPERVRLGRWLFYDKRLSSDGSVACATCHRPEHAFSEPTPVSSGVGGQKGRRKAPTIINRAMHFTPYFFWDGRASSLEEQVLGPIANPIEMGNSHVAMIATLSRVSSYTRYFKEAFGSEEITKERVAHAIADYERTRMSGNSTWDRWRATRDHSLVSDPVKKGHELFFGERAGCSQCHITAGNFTDNNLHNIGIGWNAKTKTFSDEGRYAVTKGTINEGFAQSDRGAFKTPTLRDVSKHAPYMHDGSIATLREVVEYYNRGGNKNPYMDPKMPEKPIGLTDAEIDALVAFMNALDGEGYQDVPPKTFPQ